MGFDLYFAGSQCQEADKLLIKLNCNRLFSQKNDRKNISNYCAYKNSRQFLYSGNMFIDSGAYSAHTKNININVDDYISYINDIDQYIHIFAQVDKIPGEFGKPKTINQLKEAPRLSWENYLYMKERVKSRDKLLPIFHQGENFEWLQNMLEYKHSDGTSIKYIGISPANDVSVKEKEPFIDKCFELIKKSSNPAVKTHAFGMTSLKLLERYPFTSADSTTWIMTGANGGIMTPYGVINISNKQENNYKNIVNLPLEAQKIIKDIVYDYGFDLDEARTNYKIRMCINISYLKSWADNYTYKPSTIRRKNLF